MAKRVKCLPAMQETWFRSLDREDPLEKEMAAHSSTLAWRIPWTEEPGGLQSTGSQVHGVANSRTRLSDFTFTFTLSTDSQEHPAVLIKASLALLRIRGRPGFLPLLVINSDIYWARWVATPLTR